ncbi:MAG: hypothetical protein FWF95_06980 [Syntrophorhabdaceae bacterium]|nr:hypothetical protein [Syntrophorhabdaceae bacterium]
MRRFALLFLLVVPLFCGCGPKAITEGSLPFSSGKGGFADASGRVLSNLPDSDEPFRLVFLDFTWCPACQSAWNSVHDAVEAAPPGSVRIYRILFDKEALITASGNTETAPLRPAPPPWPEFQGDTENIKITTLTALPETFLNEFRVSKTPMLLLINREGVVKKRWDGYSTNLKNDLLTELSKTAPPH